MFNFKSVLQYQPKACKCAVATYSVHVLGVLPRNVMQRTHNIIALVTMAGNSQN